MIVWYVCQSKWAVKTYPLENQAGDLVCMAEQIVKGKKKKKAVVYQLAGWTTVKNGTTAEFLPGQAVSGLAKKNKQKITLYPVWK